jgi:hypothetical protein
MIRLDSGTQIQDTRVMSLDMYLLIEDLIDAHRLWIQSSGSHGRAADFTDLDLSDWSFWGINLAGAIFTDANLLEADFSGTDLTGAIGLPVAPVVKDLDQKIFDAVQVDGLDMGSWHGCETTHCRAGWAIHLAGADGYALEDLYGPSVAGALIYFASTGRGRGLIPDWDASDDDARADIKSCAELS